MACSTCAGTGTLCLIRGDDVTFVFDFLGDDVSDSTVLFTAKRAKDNDPTDSRGIRAEGEIVDGEIVVELTAAQTQTMAPGDWWWDLKFIHDVSGDALHTAPATLCVHQPVTNRGL